MGFKPTTDTGKQRAEVLLPTEKGAFLLQGRGLFQVCRGPPEPTCLGPCLTLWWSRGPWAGILRPDLYFCTHSFDCWLRTSRTAPTPPPLRSSKHLDTAWTTATFHLVLPSQQPHDSAVLQVPLSSWEMRHREVKYLAQGHTAGKQWSWTETRAK